MIIIIISIIIYIYTIYLFCIYIYTYDATEGTAPFWNGAQVARQLVCSAGADFRSPRVVLAWLFCC